MMTRRLFGSLLAGVTTARAFTVDFVQHRILRRPHSWEHVIKAQPYWLYDCLYFTTTSQAPIRISARAEGEEESLLEMTAVPKPSGDRFMLRGIHRARAERPVTIRVESRKPFTAAVEPRFMRPDFRRVQNDEGVMMLEFYDPFYRPVPETSAFGQGQPHHRILGGPAKDIDVSLF